MLNQIRSYSYYTFQGFYKIKIDVESNRNLMGTFSYVSKIIHGWIKNKFSDIHVPDNPRTYKNYSTSITIDILYDWDKQYYVMKTTHPDLEIAGKTWVTEASLYVEDGELMLGVKNSFNLISPIDIDYKNYSCPRFIKTIINGVSLMDGEEKLGSACEILNESDLESLYYLVINSDRKYPVVVISEAQKKSELDFLYVIEDPGDYYLDGAKLSDELLGIAHVYYLPLAFQNKWNDLIGKKWQSYHGAVRTFYPGFSADDTYFQHPIMIPQKIKSMGYVNDEGKEYYYGHAFRHLLAHYIKEKNINKGINWNGTKCVFMFERERINMHERLESQKKDSDYYEFLDEYVKKVEEENEAYANDKVPRLEQEIADLKNEIFKLNSINTMAHQRLAKYESKKGSKVIEYPTSYSDFSDWVDEAFLGRVILHSRAKNMIKDADYSNINDICDAVDWLANYYYYYRTGQITAREEIDERLRELHLENTPSASKVTVGMFEEQYNVVYSGVKRRLEYHIRKGTSYDTRESFRIYYFWDDEEQRVVIGSLPKHLDTQQT